MSHATFFISSPLSFPLWCSFLHLIPFFFVSLSSYYIITHIPPPLPHCHRHHHHLPPSSCSSFFYSLQHPYHIFYSSSLSSSSSLFSSSLSSSSFSFCSSSSLLSSFTSSSSSSLQPFTSSSFSYLSFSSHYFPLPPPLLLLFFLLRFLLPFLLSLILINILLYLFVILILLFSSELPPSSILLWFLSLLSCLSALTQTHTPILIICNILFHFPPCKVLQLELFYHLHDNKSNRRPLNKGMHHICKTYSSTAFSVYLGILFFHTNKHK